MTDKEKLIEILRKPIFPHELADPTEAVADYLIDNGVTVQWWIPVTERLPRCGERVLATEGHTVFEASLSISHKWVHCGIGWAENVTHWMPLPEPPEEKDHED